MPHLDAKNFTGEDAQKRANETEHHKQDQLQSAQKTGVGKKKNELASDSEEAVCPCLLAQQYLFR